MNTPPKRSAAPDVGRGGARTHFPTIRSIACSRDRLSGQSLSADFASRETRFIALIRRSSAVTIPFLLPRTSSAFVAGASRASPLLAGACLEDRS